MVALKRSMREVRVQEPRERMARIFGFKMVEGGGVPGGGILDDADGLEAVHIESLRGGKELLEVLFACGGRSRKRRPAIGRAPSARLHGRGLRPRWRRGRAHSRGGANTVRQFLKR